jgi:hypothetical protein
MESMNKIEILKEYSFRRLRDTWAALGSLTCNEDTRFYVKDQIYVLNEPTSALNGYMFFIKDELRNTASWEIATLIDYDFGEISFQSGIISSNFVMLMTADELAQVTEPVDPTWVPFSEEKASSTSIAIPDDEYSIILSSIGAPFIQEDELEYSREQICNLFIKPALEEYFKWFPKVEVIEYPIRTSAKMEIEFPTDCYDVVHIQVNQGVGSGGPSNILLRYFDEVVWGGTGGYSTSGAGGRSTPRRNMNDFGAMMLDRAARQGMINYATRVYHNTFVRHGKRYLECSSNKQGFLQVHWAMRTFSWEDTEFARRPEIRRLCEAYIKAGFGTIRSQAKSDIPGMVEYSKWLDQAKTIKDEVIKEWKDLVKYSGVIRGSL